MKRVQARMRERDRVRPDGDGLEAVPAKRVRLRGEARIANEDARAAERRPASPVVHPPGEASGGGARLGGGFVPHGDLGRLCRRHTHGESEEPEGGRENPWHATAMECPSKHAGSSRKLTQHQPSVGGRHRCRPAEPLRRGLE